MTPRLLDLFCGAGGCSVGYARAGFDVVGVDVEAHPDYPFSISEADAMTVLANVEYLDTFDVVHASPPCQAFSRLKRGSGHPELVEPVRQHLRAWGGAYVVENVVGAPLVDPVKLCGSEFGLGATCKDGVWRYLQRHRLFESNVPLARAGACVHKGQAVGVYGHGGNIPSQHGYAANAAEAREAMGIDWMKHYDVVQAIPPAYTEWIGKQLLEHVATRAA